MRVEPACRQCNLNPHISHELNIHAYNARFSRAPFKSDYTILHQKVEQNQYISLAFIIKLTDLFYSLKSLLARRTEELPTLLRSSDQRLPTHASRLVPNLFARKYGADFEAEVVAWRPFMMKNKRFLYP